MDTSKNIINSIYQRRSMKYRKVIHQEWILQMLNSIDKKGFDIAFYSDEIISFVYKADETLKITGRKQDIKKVEFFKKGKLILKFYVEKDLSFTSSQGDHHDPTSLFDNVMHDLFTKRFLQLYELVFAPLDSALIKPTSFFSLEIPIRKVLIAFNAIARGDYRFKNEVGILHDVDMYTAANKVDIVFDGDTFLFHEKSVTIKYFNEEYLTVIIGKDGRIKSLKDEKGCLNDESLVYFKLSLDRFLIQRKDKEDAEKRQVQETENLKEEIIKKMNQLNGYKANSVVTEVANNLLLERESQLLQAIPRFPIKECRDYLHQFIPLFNEIDVDNVYLDIVDQHKYERLKEVRLIGLMKSYTALEENEQRNQFQSFMATVKSMMGEAQAIQSKIKDKKLYEFNKQVVLNLQA